MKLTTQLSETRKADRPKMLAIVETLATEYGFTFTHEDPFSPKQLRGTIHGDKAQVGIDFDGESCQPNVFVLTWNTKGASRFAMNFGDVNPFHQGKATRVCQGMYQLVYVLGRDLASLKNGKAFEQ